MPRQLLLPSAALTFALTLALSALANPPASTQPASSSSTTQPSTQPSSEDVMQDLLRHRNPNPVIPPSSRLNVISVPNLDSRLTPTAPIANPVTLRREGEMIVNRRGRIIHTGSGTSLFIFDNQTDKAAEAPMILMPCAALQNMEDLTREQGAKTPFMITGQVFLYRGANYLLPTLLQPATDNGLLLP